MGSLLRKPQARKQGLKILAYGTDGTGKSVYGLGFPKVAILDAEAKMGVYESNSERNKNMVAIADSSNYYDCLNVVEEVIKSKGCSALMIDSETYIQDALKVASMETEEARAIKKGNDPTDQSVSQRGWGKISLNIARLRMLKAQASSDGITVISTAHKKDIMQKVGADTVKVGEKPNIRDGCTHEYDVILKFYKEKDLATGKLKYKAVVEKDTTETFEVGTIIENPCYETTYKDYLEKNGKLDTVKTSYETNLSDTISTLNDEAQNFEDLSNEFATLFKELKDKDAKNAVIVKKLLDDNKITSYKKPEFFEQLKVVVAQLKTM